MGLTPDIKQTESWQIRRDLQFERFIYYRNKKEKDKKNKYSNLILLIMYKKKN
jgi:hypothetical protein